MSATVIEVAEDMRLGKTSEKLGELLVSWGRVKPQTVKFFIEQWPLLLLQKQRFPIGYYLEQAGLLTRTQIHEILAKQQNTGMLFGDLVVAQEQVSRVTIDFFLNSLDPKRELSLENGRLLADFLSRAQEGLPGDRGALIPKATVIPASETPPVRPAAAKPSRARGLLIFGGLGIVVALLAFAVRLGFLVLGNRSAVISLFNRGNQHLGEQAYTEAIETYDRLLAKDANYYQAWTNRGYALAGLKRFAEMLESCRTATLIEPTAAYAWNCQGEALHNLQRDEDAIVVYDRAIEIDGDDPVLWVNRSISLLAALELSPALRSVDRAIEQLEGIRQSDSDPNLERELAIALSHKGRILQQQQNHQAAFDAFEQALSHSEQYFPALRGLGIALKSLGEHQKADIQFTSILDRTPLSTSQQAEIWFYKGLNLCSAGQSGNGQNSFTHALELGWNDDAVRDAQVNCSAYEQLAE
ncbi:MAG: tetratricopeptide repeat protein [Cyanobacteria bacterium J06641_5]